MNALRAAARAASFSRLGVVAVLALTLGCAEGPIEGFSSEILTRDLRAHVAVLAGTETEGREPGTIGIERAEAHIAGAFAAAGLSPVSPTGGFGLDFDLYRFAREPSSARLRVRGAGMDIEGRLNVDFRTFFFSDAGSYSGPIEFAGYGIVAPEYKWDDYAAKEVAGKAVFMLRYEPAPADPKRFRGAELTNHSFFLTKARTAAGQGAEAMLLVTGPRDRMGIEDLRDDRLISLSRKERAAGPSRYLIPGFLGVQVSWAFAEAIAAAAGTNLKNLQVDAEAGNRVSFDGLTMDLTIPTPGPPRPFSGRNLVGLVPGTDLADEWVVVGAHHDHLGRSPGPEGPVYFGADDNASGVSAVLELASYFVERPTRRTLAFVTFSAEEAGLLGSRALLDSSDFPAGKVVFMLNLDMIGRNPGRPLSIYGDGFAAGLKEIVEEVNPGLVIEYGGRKTYPVSDHAAFHDREIPYLAMFSGVHEDYHQPSDTPEKLDYERIAAVAGLSVGIIERIANAETAPEFLP